MGKRTKRAAKVAQGRKNAKGEGVPEQMRGAMGKKEFNRDARRQVLRNNDVSLNNQENAIVFAVPLIGETLLDVAIAYVSKGLSKGFMADASSPNDPYSAMVFVYQILVQFVNGSTPQVQTLPYWLLSLGRALSPKTVPFQQGKASYSWELEEGAVLASPHDFGYNPYGFKWVVGGPNESSTVDNFPVALPPTLNSDGGAFAFQELAQFMATHAGGDNSASKSAKLVPISTKTMFDSDVSAFAYLTNFIGTTDSGTGGFASVAQNEVPIFTPLLASFARATSDAGSPGRNRFFNFLTQVSGDALWTTNCLDGFIDVARWGMRRPARFHAVDFLEFGDVLARWVQKVVQNYYNDPEYKVAAQVIEGPGVVAAEITNQALCPLTLQEMLILLRNVLMAAFKDTQAGTQALYPSNPQSQTDNQFQPYYVGSNTCPIATLDMMLPSALVENARTLIARYVQMSSNKKDICYFVGVLGQYVLDTLNAEDYLVTDNQGNTFSVFQTTPVIKHRVVDAKTQKVSYSMMAEQVISLVDGNSVSGSTVYVFINDPTRLKQLCALWNTWLSINNLSNYSMPLKQFGTELGISSLTSICATRHWINTPPTVKQNRIENEDVRFSKMKIAMTPYAVRQTVADTNQSIWVAATYEGVLNTWILPVNKVQIDGGPIDLSGVTLTQRIQGMNGEPYLAVNTSGNAGEDMNMLHDTYASKMVKSKLSPPNEWTLFLETQEKLGRGGILSSLASAFAGAAFGPAGASVASALI